MAELVLDVTTRTVRGRHNGAERRGGSVPAILYGHNVEPVALSADARALARIWQRAGRTHLVELKVDGAKSIKVLIKEFQREPRSSLPVHADFFAVNLLEKLTADVPIVMVGLSPAVEELKTGQLIQPMPSLKVECLPQDLPSQLSVDVSVLANIDDHVLVGDLVLPKGVVLIHADLEDVLVKVIPVRVQAAEEPTEAEAAAATAAAEAAEAAAAEPASE